MSTSISVSYHSGLSGLQLPIPKYQFPPEHQSSSRLQYYSTIFNSLEVNSTFYKLPLKTTLAKWSDSVGQDFKFTIKVWKQVTHNRGLQFDEKDVDKVISVANNIGKKKGCFLIQFPPSTKIGSIDQLALLLKTFRGKVKTHWRIALEFRDGSWYHRDTLALSKKYNAIIVTHDKANTPSPFIHETSDTVYVRFHGPSGDYRGSYSNDFLSEYASYVKDWLAYKKNVYVYFNNTMGNAFNNLNTLNKYVANRLR